MCSGGFCIMLQSGVFENRCRVSWNLRVADIWSWSSRKFTRRTSASKNCRISTKESQWNTSPKTTRKVRVLKHYSIHNSRRRCRPPTSNLTRGQKLIMCDIVWMLHISLSIRPHFFRHMPQWPCGVGINHRRHWRRCKAGSGTVGSSTSEDPFSVWQHLKLWWFSGGYEGILLELFHRANVLSCQCAELTKTVHTARVGIEFVFICLLGWVIYLYVCVCFVLPWTVESFPFMFRCWHNKIKWAPFEFFAPSPHAFATVS